MMVAVTVNVATLFSVLILRAIKTIFHCNAKPLVLGLHVWSGPQHKQFGLPIPTCWYLKSLVNPKRRTMDPKLGSPRVGARVGHVHFMLFMSIEITLGT